MKTLFLLSILVVLVVDASVANSDIDSAELKNYTLTGLTQEVKFVVKKSEVRIEAKRIRSDKWIHLFPIFEITLNGKKYSDKDTKLKNVTVTSTSVKFVHTIDNVEMKTSFELEADHTWMHWKFDFTVLSSSANPTYLSFLYFDRSHLPADSMSPFLVGNTQASPFIVDGFFLQPGDPLMNVGDFYGECTQTIQRNLTIEAGRTLSYDGYLGTYEEGQIRRNFNVFINEVRPRKYKQLLHYNSWLDIGAFTPYDQHDAISRIKQFSKHMSEERNVKMDGFLFDDGWDDYHGDWKFDPKRFPHGFYPLKTLTDKIDAYCGIWISPWGGYGPPHKERVTYGHKHFGYEVIDGNFALSGPKYYKNFHHQMMGFISNYSILLFKIDGTGDSGIVIPGSQFTSDFDAATHLLSDMRKLAGDRLYVSLTTGTYASPAWLLLADNIWRGGADTEFAGPGSKVQQWLTYRDLDTYNGVVMSGPLFPINSLMLHGIVYAKYSGALKEQSDNDFRDQVWSYFATGTQLQEMYCTPDLLDDQNWDDMAEAARWARGNEAVLFDVHWIGGNPNPPVLQVYGHGAWTPEKSIIHLRNPLDLEQEYYVDLKNDLELPPHATDKFDIEVDYRSTHHSSMVIPTTIKGGHLFVLAPYENIIISLYPKYGL